MAQPSSLIGLAQPAQEFRMPLQHAISSRTQGVPFGKIAGCFLNGRAALCVNTVFACGLGVSPEMTCSGEVLQYPALYPVYPKCSNFVSSNYEHLQATGQLSQALDECWT